MKKNLDKIIYYLILGIVILLPFLKLTSYNLYFLNVIDNSFDFPHVYFLWIALIFLIITYMYGVKKGEFKVNYIDYIFLGLIVFAFISTVFAVNRKLSIFGEINRNEGLLSILTYYFIALLTKNIKDKKYINNIINTMLVVGVFQVVYAILQVFTDLSFIKHYSKSFMAHSLCGNPNFFGSYLVMLICISINKFLLDKKYKYLLLSIIYFIGLVLAASTGPFMTAVIMIIFMIIKNFKYTKIKYILLLLVFVPTLFITNYFVKLKYEDVSIDNYNIITDINSAKNKDVNSLTNGRIEIWKNSVPLVKKYYLLGSGLDNFGEVYEYSTNSIRYDKAHNVYLQILITNGIVPLLLVLIICVLVFVKGLKNTNSLYLSIYFACIGYMIQAFANISVIDVAPTFFILLGLSLNKDVFKSI